MKNAMVVYRGKPKGNSWVRWMNARTLRKNQNNLIAITGGTGSGKTWSAISISLMSSKLSGVPFTIDHIVFSLTELMELLNSDKLRKGSCIIFDEPQISISAREFQSEANKVFNYLVSTFRHRNLTLFFCAPFESLLDKNTRRLFHCRLETMSIDKNREVCRLKPRYLEFTDSKPEPYRKQLIVVFKDEQGVNRTRKLFDWCVPKPSSQELIDQYEKKRKEFTDNLNKNITARLKKFEDTGKSMTGTTGMTAEALKYRKPLTEKQKRVMEVVANVRESNKYETAGKILGISKNSIANSIKLAQKKGYYLGEFKKNEEIVKQNE